MTGRGLAMLHCYLPTCAADQAPSAAMSAISSLRDLQSIQALTHDLYAHCQRPSSVSRPIAKNLRTLRNKLEEADEALHDSTVRPEAVLVLYATGKSREVLEEINGVLEDHDGGVQNPNHLGVEDIICRLDAVTFELSNTLQALSMSTGTLDMLLDTSFRGSAYAASAGSRKSSVASLDRLRNASSRSVTHPSSTARTSVSEWLSLGRYATLPDPPGEHEVQSPPLPTVRAAEACEQPSTRSHGSGTPDPWQSPFASPDPMSTSIDTASSLILRTESSRPYDRCRDRVASKGLQDSCRCCLGGRNSHRVFVPPRHGTDR
ncbi:hypothetical protein DOTSEDRAFT_70738 [Dothistroma septosporum NZE10]|uniref:Uncharacterized protein n=1 Tax=Dothistroma septosporum (strain NZE10 / CBS 128990) TaxID=675120 RepID=N1PVA5_DOTSN|nr:hypothetical protein DOTSEDRAFT_70738 [Dothistroma septosporum NZE10]